MKVQGQDGTTYVVKKGGAPGTYDVLLEGEIVGSFSRKGEKSVVFHGEPSTPDVLLVAEKFVAQGGSPMGM